jgi:hypothetical protein
MYTINAPHVVHDTIENETILFNLKTGNYYSFDSFGVVLWNAIIEAYNISDFIEKLAQKYDKTQAEIKEIIDGFLSELLKEELIVQDKNKKETENNIDKSIIDKLAIELKSPVLHKYTNMQDMLLLDPIHDTGEKGWPSGKDSFE